MSATSFEQKLTTSVQVFRIHFADISEELLLERIKARNAQLTTGTFQIPETKLKEWMLLFEPPLPDEFIP